MVLILAPLEQADLVQFKQDMQEAFNLGAEKECGEGCTVLPESDIDRSLQEKSAVAFKAVLNGKMVGGAIVQIHAETQRNSLDFLYVKSGFQGKKIGQFIWSEIEKIYPKTQVWETHTPYFDQRNIHFYVNQCGFQIVEFFNPYHPDPNDHFEVGDPMENMGMFRFEKKKS